MIKNNTIDLSMYKYDDRKNNNLLMSLNRIKKYPILKSVKISDNKAYVIYTDEFRELEVIYNYITFDDICKNLDDDIDISFCAIQDFSIQSIGSKKTKKIKAFSSLLSNANFDKAEFESSTVDFSYSRFHDGASFREVKYNNCKVNFQNILIYANDLFFCQSEFINSEVKFNKSIFEKCDVDFSWSIFDKGVDFSECVFSGKYTNFSGCKFKSNIVNFERARFQGVYLELDELDCSSIISFKNSEINLPNFMMKNSYFYNCNISFEYTIFNSDYFWVENCSFEKSNFSVLCCDLERTNIKFYNCRLDKLIFEGVVFEREIGISCNPVKKLGFINCKIRADLVMDKHMEWLEYPYTQYNTLSFKGSIVTGDIYIDWDRNNVFQAIENGITEELEKNLTKKDNLSKEKNIKWFLSIGNITADKFESNREKISNYNANEDRMSQYRMLKNNFNRIGYYEDEDKALVKFMDNYLELNNTKSSKFTKWMFSNIGGYGTEPKSIITFALFLVFMFACFYTILGVDTSEPAKLIPYEMLDGIFKCLIININKFIVSFYFSGITFLTVGYGDVLPTSGLIMFLTVAEGFLGVFTMSYFSVAVVRKILR